MSETMIPSWKCALEMYKSYNLGSVTYSDLAKKYDIETVYVDRRINKIRDLLYSNEILWGWNIDNLSHLMEVSSKYIEDTWVTRVAAIILKRFRSPKEFLLYGGPIKKIQGAGAKYVPVLVKIYNDEEYRKTYLGG